MFPNFVPMVNQYKAIHTGPNAAKAPADDAGGLEAVIFLAQSARIMLTSNLWVDVGLVNGAMGTIQAICYRAGGPPDLPIAVMVQHSTMEQFPSPLYDVHGLH
jgi:ATP-dependent DNA helicase PIF1